MKNLHVFALATLILFCFLIPVGCVIEDEEDDDGALTDTQMAIAREVAASYAFSFRAVQTHINGGNENHGSDAAGAAATGCPSLHWWNECDWIIDFGTGCTANDGNYYSGSISAESCDELAFNQFCQNDYCIDGSILFQDDVSCPAAQCYHEEINATLSGPDDTVTIVQNATAGVTGTTYFLFAPSSQAVTSVVHGSYTAQVLQDLVKDETLCPYPTTGTVKIVVTGEDPITIDFNTGNCYTAYVNGVLISLTEE